MAAPSRLPLLQFCSTRVFLLRCTQGFHGEPVVREPAYPPVIPSRTAKSKSAKKRREEDYYNQVRAASLVQDKLRLLTRLQRKKYVVYPQTFTLNADRWYQHFTKTVFLPGLPGKCSVGRQVVDKENGKVPPAAGGVDPTVLDENTFSELRSLVGNGILQENFYLKKRRPFLQKEQEHFVAPFLSNLVSSVTSSLAKYNPLLKMSSLDFNPEVSFYWMRGERTVPRGHRRGRVDPIRFQINDQPHCQIRVPEQLEEFLPLQESVSAEVPVVHFEPNRLPMFQRQYDNNIFIGSKVTDPCSYGHTQFHLVHDRFKRGRLIKGNLADQVEVRLRANAIASLFAWTGAQAMYQGFWSHEDLTRPFVSQAVVTDGQYFSFFCYQLNTLALTVQTDQDNPRKNICWGTESMRLYEQVKDGEVVGLNDDVLKLLVNFLLNKPQKM
ncbi:28S ribosomal protein S30, mitochondrial-like [Polyodon spathula]|uniref:28S ribosomal protein S30, mitochondrial-like n=1 Tax=Polyodon spathula TaxID=7913 RepID=UPI001B7F02B9|nr:28S ribosomal protein S30, mitochondrial-like [Polyodon spathula]